MRFIAAILFACLVSPIATQAQKNTFNWNDTQFHVGSKRVLYTLLTDVDHGWINLHDSMTLKTLDTIFLFLKKHPDLVIEVGYHTAHDGSAGYALSISQHRAEQIVAQLIYKGIDSARLVAKGYGFTKPIVTQELINKIHREKGRFDPSVYNLRTEITILSTEYKNE